MAREIILLAIGALFGLGATVAGVAAPVLYPNVPQWIWHGAFWGGIALMALMAFDAACLLLWHPRLTTIVFLNFGLGFLALAGIAETSPIQKPASASRIQTVRQAFSSTQSLKTLPTFLGGNETLRLDNAAVLHLSAPYSDTSVTLILDDTPIRFPDQDKDGLSVRDAYFSTHDKKNEILFDVGENKRHEIVVGDRTFIVALLEIRQLATPNVAKPREYVFGISEK